MTVVFLALETASAGKGVSEYFNFLMCRDEGQSLFQLQQPAAAIQSYQPPVICILGPADATTYIETCFFYFSNYFPLPLC